MIVNNIKITDETIATTKQWFIDNSQAIIDKHADKPNLFWHLAIKTLQEQTSGYSLAFMQRALFIQTGACPAILS